MFDIIEPILIIQEFGPTVYPSTFVTCQHAHEECTEFIFTANN